MTCPCGLRIRQQWGCPRPGVSRGVGAPEACHGTWPRDPCAGWCRCRIAGRRTVWSSSTATPSWTPRLFCQVVPLCLELMARPKATRAWTIPAHHHAAIEHKRRGVQHISLFSLQRTKNGPPEGDPFLFEVFLGDQSSNPGIQGHWLPHNWKKSRRSFTSTSPSPVKSPGQGSR